MNEFIKILGGTPVWVWAILGYLIYAGILALKPRVISLQRLIILPLILIAFKYKIFALPDAWIYLVTFVAGLSLGYFKVRNSPIQIMRTNKTILLPGSSSMIVILVSIFLLKYYSGYLQFSDPAAYLRFTPVDLALSGLLSGYFSGQRFFYLYKYYNA